MTLPVLRRERVLRRSVAGVGTAVPQAGLRWLISAETRGPIGRASSLGDQIGGDCEQLGDGAPVSEPEQAISTLITRVAKSRSVGRCAPSTALSAASGVISSSNRSPQCLRETITAAASD